MSGRTDTGRLRADASSRAEVVVIHAAAAEDALLLPVPSCADVTGARRPFTHSVDKSRFLPVTNLSAEGRARRRRREQVDLNERHTVPVP